MNWSCQRVPTSKHKCQKKIRRNKFEDLHNTGRRKKKKQNETKQNKTILTHEHPKTIDTIENNATVKLNKQKHQFDKAKLNKLVLKLRNKQFHKPQA